MSTAEWVATACNPAHSVVVEACAGSGKTWLLTARLFRLLLAGVPAHRIVAITFTRKAAQEMHERLGDLLAECALASDAELARLLTERGAATDAATCARARALAGQVLTDGRGVVIDTFHGWFASLCQLAPLSMGFSRQAEPTDQAAQWQQLAIRLYVQGLVEAKATNSAVGKRVGKPVANFADTLASPQHQALSTLAQHLGQRGLQHVLALALQQRVACTLWLADPGPCVLEQHWQGLAAHDQSASAWPEQALQDPSLPGHLAVLVQGLRLGTAAQQKGADALLAVQSEPSQQEQFAALRALVLTQADAPRAGSPFKPTKGQTDHPNFCPTAFAQAFDAVCAVVLHGLAMLRDLEDWQCSQALKVLLPGLFAQYAQCMSEANVCDFDQLEAVALDLLRHPDERAYVLQKMDARAAHVLLDEFQDTNPVQWAILRLWLEQYDASEHPTVFMVGDPKQSIYRFRRAEARLFGRVRDWLVQRFGAVALESNQTRRCQPGVVAVVNAAFDPALRQNRTHFAPHHSLAPARVGGQVGEQDAPALRRYPLCESLEEEARAVALALQAMHCRGQIGSLSDVLVLVHTRQTGQVLAQALRGLGLPFVVKDAGERYQSPLWQDTLALLYFLQDPHNNLALLTVLRSPLVGLASPALQTLADHAAHSICLGSEESDPPCATVWATLASLAEEESSKGANGIGPEAGCSWLALHARLSAWLHTAHTLPLLETLHQVCGGAQALQAYLNAANPEQRDLYAMHWDWLKGWVLGLQQGRFVGVQQAIDAALVLQQHGGSEGEAPSTQQGVRIMTIHSAKGLEAEHVWLFFCDEKPSPQGSRAGLVLDWPLDRTAPQGVTVMGNTSKPSPSRAALLQAQQAAFDDEADHLLYVALTRARRCLHLSSSTAKKAKRGWYARLVGLGADVPWPTVADIGAEVGVDVEADVGADAVPGAVSARAPGAAPTTWVYAEHPPLPALPGLATFFSTTPQADVQSPEQRMGQAWHALLEQLNWQLDGGFDAWWQARWFDCEAWLLDLTEAEQAEVRQACAAVWHSAQVQAWLAAPGVVVLPELRWMLPQEQEQTKALEQPQEQTPALSNKPLKNKLPKTLRADCVVVLPTHVLVLDYKWTVNASNLPTYTEQVRRYVACVEHTVRTPQHGPTKAALLDRTATLYPIELG